MKNKNIQIKKNILQENTCSDDEVEEDGQSEDSSNSNEVESDSENDSQGGDENVSEDGDENDLAASATDSESSDEDDLAASATDSESSDEDEDGEQPKTKADIIKEDVLKRYQERQGRQLYIRFPHKLPNTEKELEDMAKKLSPLIVKVHKPRQKHARFCLVDFNSKDDRDAALNAIRDTIKKGDLAKYVVNIPRTESVEYVNELAERKIKSLENKKTKARLKKASKKALNPKSFTPTVIVLNLPKTASLLQIRELFSNAVDIQIKAGKGKLNKDKSIAVVTLPSTLEARKAVKQKLSLGGNQLNVKFDNVKREKAKTGQKRPVTGEKESTADADGDSEPGNKKQKIEKTQEDKISLKNKNKNKKSKLFKKKSNLIKNAE